MNKIIAFIVLILAFTACQSKKSPIITSKEKALKTGNYRTAQKTTVNRNLEKSQTTKTEEREIGTSEMAKAYKSKGNYSSVEMAQFLINTASEYKGTRYKGGGTTDAGMDCSGLVFRTFITHDITLPRSSHEMATVGNKIPVRDIQPGDLVFFKTMGGKRISHVGLVTEIVNGEVFFIHSSTQKGVIVSSMNEAYYERTFVQANRVL
jgi:murein DD-endopeptidase / murein LD-carboxypeptidase